MVLFERRNIQPMPIDVLRPNYLEAVNAITVHFPRRPCSRRSEVKTEDAIVGLYGLDLALRKRARYTPTYKCNRPSAQFSQSALCGHHRYAQLRLLGFTNESLNLAYSALSVRRFGQGSARISTQLSL